MRKTLLTFFTLAALLNCRQVNAQITWTLQGADITGQSLFIGDISAVNDSVAWAIAGSYNGGMCETPVTRFTRTTNGGTNWRSGSISAPFGYNTWNISAIDGLTAWVSTFDQFTQSNGRVYKTSNGGATWVHQATATFTSACKFVHFFNANDGVAVGQNQVFVTGNGGTNWVQQVDLPVPFAVSANFLINSYEVLGNSIWLGDSEGTIYYSSNKGLTWTVRSGPTGMLGNTGIKGIAFKDSLNGLAVSSVFIGGGSGGGAHTDNGSFYRTSDGGITWTSFPYNSTQLSITAQYYAKYDVCYIPGTLNSYILSSEYNSINKFSIITTDGGNTWTYIDSTVAHTALDFVATGTGWSGGHITGVSDGIYKWAKSAPTNTTNTTALAEHQKKLNEHVNILYDGPSIFVSNTLPGETLDFLSILSIEGKLIKTVQCSPAILQQLDTGSLSEGTYILEAGIGKSTLHKKFIVQR